MKNNQEILRKNNMTISKVFINSDNNGNGIFKYFVDSIKGDSYGSYETLSEATKVLEKVLNEVK